MFDKKTEAFLEAWLPSDYCAQVVQRIKSRQVHRSQVSHVRKGRRADIAVARQILMVAKANKRKQERIARSLSIKG